MRVKLGLVLMDGDIFSKYVIQFSVDGWSCVPSPLLTWGQTIVEVMKIMVTFFKRCHAHTAPLSAPNPAAGHHRPTPPPATPGYSWASLGQSLTGSLSFLLGPGVQCFVCALQQSVSTVLCKFWRPFYGVNGDLLQEGLCYTQVCCIQSPCPCGRPLLTHTSAGDSQTLKGHVWLSLCGFSWCTQGFV